MEKIVIPIILVNIGITFVQMIIFEFENMIYLFSRSLPKTQEHFQIQNNVHVCIQLYFL